ncbi:MAG: AraC family transcriptional regulator [Gammaproteobacteria bacterium]|nr:AraC family transcriptional regulator [Gammaproteobacteria bacterium]
MSASMYVNGALVGMLIDYLEAKQVAAPVFKAQLVELQAQERISIQTWISLLDEVARLTPIPAVGLSLGQYIKASHTGIVGYLGLSCGSVGEALALFERFARLIYDVNSLSMTMENDTVTISWGSEHVAPGQLADETAISVFFTMVQVIAGRALYPTKVNFINVAPADLTPYEEFFHCPVTFGGIRTIVEFPAEYLNITLEKKDTMLLDLLEGHAQTLLNTLPTDEFEKRLKKLFTDMLKKQEMPSLEQVASRMHTSVRTLQRRLNEHEIKFQELLADVKLDLFNQYIKDESLTLFDIALLLGYSEQSAFTRAVKRWTGKLPKNFRKP